MITGSLNLSALKHVIMETKGKSGQVKGVFIPLEANDLQQHENGNVYINVVAFEMKEPKDYATHIVKQSFPKEKRESMSKEEKDAQPILGNLKTTAPNSGDANNNAGGGQTFMEDDDLPF
jgi:hypothetical protein